jgi:hypothetical protein
VYLQAVFFRIFGVDYGVYLFLAALLNVIAALEAMRILTLLFPTRRWGALIAGAVTAVWFFPPFGTPFGEQCAFLLGLVGIDFLLTALLRADETQPQGSAPLLVAAGVCAGLAWYCKQNVGLFLAPFFLLTPCVVWFPDSRRTAAASRWLMLGFFAALVLPAGVYWLSGRWQSFLYFYLLLPLATALRRAQSLDGAHGGIGAWVLWASILLLVCGIGYSLRARMAAAAARLYEFRSRELRSTLAVWLAFYAVLISVLVRKTMLNSPTIADIYIGILLGIVFTLAADREDRGTSKTAGRVLAFFSVVVFCFGLFLSWERKVHESVDGAQFGQVLPIERLAPLRWGEPTIVREGVLPKDVPGVRVSEHEMLSLIQFLEGQDRNFFVFPDFTFLYAVLQKPSPQPLLFFHRGLTYPTDYNPDLDQWVVESLIENEVSLVVLEERSFFGTLERLEDFPFVSQFLEENFVELRKIGLFRVLALRTVEE